MPVDRRLPPKQRIKQCMQPRRLAQLLTARHVRDALQVIVMYRGEVIAGATLLAPQHHVAEGTRVGRPRRQPMRCLFHKIQRIKCGTQRARRRIHRQPPGEWRAFRQLRRFLGIRQRLAHERLPRRGMRRAHGLLDILARFEAAIDQPAPPQMLQQRFIFGHVLRLHPHRLLPADAQPGEILENPLHEMRPAARLVDILDAQDEPPARRLRLREIQPRRIGMAQVQPSRRRGCETCDHLHNKATDWRWPDTPCSSSVPRGYNRPAYGPARSR